MSARWRVALAATAALVASAGTRAASAGTRAEDEETCELGRSVRSSATSRGCMTCHDGSAGPSVPFKPRAVRFKIRGDDRGISHPVEINYAAVAAAHPGQYQPAALLPPEVPLVGGRIECTTCHDGAARGPKRVVAVHDLCLSCHRK